MRMAVACFKSAHAASSCEESQLMSDRHQFQCTVTLKQGYLDRHNAAQAFADVIASQIGFVLLQGLCLSRQIVQRAGKGRLHHKMLPLCRWQVFGR